MLSLTDVRVTIGDAVLLDGVSLEVRPGEVVGVVGANGAGKSTLLSVMAGERPPTSGRARLGQHPLTEVPPETLARRRAVLPQHSTLAFSFSVFEVVRMGRAPHAASRDLHEAAAWRALERVGVAHLAERLYPTLSGGEQQRVHLARTLAQLDAPVVPDETGDASRFLLLDEPTASLDLAHQHGVLRTARSLAANGIGVMVVLHDLNLAAQYADRLAVLRRGRLLADGPPEAVLTPDLVHSAFEVSVTVMAHPCLSCPLVVALPEGSATPRGPAEGDPIPAALGDGAPLTGPRSSD